MNTYQPTRDSIHNIFENLSNEEITLVEKSSIRQQYKANQYILKNEINADYIFRIDHGYAINERFSHDGTRHVMAFLSQGYFIGFFDLLSFGISVKALRDTEVTAFPRERFLALSEEIPKIKDNIDRITKAIMASAFDYMYMISQKNAVQRVCFFLQQIALRENNNLDDAFTLPCSREDIADHLGLSKETVSRTMSRLRAGRIIKQEKLYEFRIIDPTAISSMAH